MKSINVCAAVLLCAGFVLSCNQHASEKAKDIVATDVNKETGQLNVAEKTVPEIADEKFQQTQNNTADTTRKTDQQPTITSTQPKIDWDKKIIKTATLNAEVKNYTGYYSSLREKVRSVGGYIAQEEQSQSDYKVENSIVIKVPVDQFDNAIELLSSGVKVNERKVSSQDVTTEVIDVRARIEAKKRVRDRYVGLMKEAKNMTEIQSVQSEIDGIQEQLESAAGRATYLSQSAAFSTINLTVFQILDVTVKDKNEPSVWTRFATSFTTGLSWLVDMVIGLLSIWPLLILFFIAWRIIKRYTKAAPKTS